jgi:hypothetical protein
LRSTPIPRSCLVGIEERAETPHPQPAIVARGHRQKAYKIRAFRDSRNDSSVARVLHSRLQKLGNVENVIRRIAFLHRLRMHARVRCIGTRTRPRFRAAVRGAEARGWLRVKLHECLGETGTSTASSRLRSLSVTKARMRPSSATPKPASTCQPPPF